MGKKIWIQIDEDEIEYLEDAGLSVTQVQPAVGQQRIMFFNQAYNISDLQKTKEQMISWAANEGDRVRAFWQRGLMGLSAQVVQETEWKPRERRLPPIMLDEIMGGAPFKMAMEQLAREMGRSGMTSSKLRDLMQQLHREGAVDNRSDAVYVDYDSPAGKTIREALNRKREANEEKNRLYRDAGFTGQYRTSRITGL